MDTHHTPRKETLSPPGSLGSVAKDHASTQRARKGQRVLELYGAMLRVRYFDLAIAPVAPAGFRPTIGAEAMVAGVATALGARDALVASWLGHAFALAAGVPASVLAAKILASAATERTPERSASDAEVFQGGPSFATELAIEDRKRGRRRRVVCVIGGDVLSDDYRDALASAIDWRLPIVYVCENNQLRLRDSGAEAYEHARGCDVVSDEVDGMDPRAVASVVRRACDELCLSSGPRVVESLTFYPPPDPGLDASTALAQVAARLWRTRDPIEQYRARCVEQGLAPDEAFAVLDGAIEAEISRAVSLGKVR